MGRLQYNKGNQQFSVYVDKSRIELLGWKKGDELFIDIKRKNTLVIKKFNWED